MHTKDSANLPQAHITTLEWLQDEQDYAVEQFRHNRQEGDLPAAYRWRVRSRMLECEIAEAMGGTEPLLGGQK